MNRKNVAAHDFEEVNPELEDEPDDSFKAEEVCVSE